MIARNVTKYSFHDCVKSITPRTLGIPKVIEEYLYLFIGKYLNSFAAGSGRINAKEEREEGKVSKKCEEKEWDRGTKGETPYSHHGQMLRS